MIKLVIFDLDGTIINNKSMILCELVSESFGIDSESVRSAWKRTELIMKNKQGSCSSVKDYFYVFNTIFLKELGLVPEEKMKELNELVKRMRNEVKNGIQVHDGIIESLSLIRKKGKFLSLLTGGWQGNLRNFSQEFIKTKVKRIHEILRNNDLEKYFDFIFITYVDGVLKPDMRTFQKVLDHFKVRPEEAVMIGDSEQDILAKRLGIKTILFDPYGTYESDVKPDFVIKHYSELPGVLKEIEKQEKTPSKNY